MSAGILDTCYFIFGIVVAWPLIRLLRIWSLQARATSHMPLAAGEGGRLAETFSRLAGDKVTAAELGTYAGVTAADFVWTWATISPEVIQAADFSSSYSIHNGFQFAQYLHNHFDTLTSAGKDGFINHLLGYIGEQQVADILIQQGHTVEMAASATQPVWDMWVDGHAVNVKTVANVASIKAEAAAHPGVLYLVPEDAHGHVAGNIVHLAGFKHEIAKESLHESIAGGNGEAALHGLLHHLPLVTIGFATYRNYKAVQKGKNLGVAVHHGLAEIAGRGTGVYVGVQCGAAVGGFLGPLGSLLGALVGGFAGALLGGAIVEDYKQIPLRKAQERFEHDLNTFGLGFKYHFDEIRGYLEAPLINMRRGLRELTEEAEKRKRTVRWFFWPDFYTILLDEAVKKGTPRLQKECSNIDRVNKLLDDAVRSGAYTKVGLLMANSPVVRELVGHNQDLLDQVKASRQKLFFQRKQLNPDFVVPT